MEDLWDDWRRRLTIVVQPVQSLLAAEAETENFGPPMVVLNRSTTSSHKNENGNVGWDQGFGRKSDCVMVESYQR
jgi:hypothetical protein